MLTSSTTLITSNPLLASPAKIPIIALAFIPTKSPVFGTVTHLAFLIILPLHHTITYLGISPKTSLALAEA